MKRRDFIRKSSVVGLSGLLGHGSSYGVKKQSNTSDAGFDIHPLIKKHPDAVFIKLTSVKTKKDTEAIYGEGYKLAQEIITTTNTGGFPLSTLVTLKHNWHGIQKVDDLMGENTDPNFIEGWMQGMMEAGPQRYYANSAGDLNKIFTRLDFQGLANENGVNLEDYNKEYKAVPDGAIKFLKIPDGVVFDTMGHITPYGDHGTFLVNMAKFKAHSMGITGAIKNLQGLCPGLFRRFCTPYNQLRKRAGKQYGKFLKKNFEKNIEKLYARHVEQGIPRWYTPAKGNRGYRGGIWQEQWVQRMLDSLSVSPKGLHIIEGIYGMDGNGFGAGPHEKSPNGFTSRDFMSNVLLFGLDPFRVDIISHWMAGHEPGNFGLFHIGIERGMSDVLDPNDIPVYFWKDGEATITKLDNLPVTPLKTLYLQKNYGGFNEPTFHLCNEPFDYSAWKVGKHTGNNYRSPLKKQGIALDDSHSLPTDKHVYVNILDRDGEIVGQLLADGELDPGNHQVVWDGFDAPGLYNVYFKGMDWDTEKKIAIYT